MRVVSLPIVTLDRVDVRLGGAPVLRGVSLSLRAGEGLGILGANGSGKSTLLRLLRGDVWPDPRAPGRRLFHGRDGAHGSPIGVRERIARLAPEDHDAYVRRDWDLPVEAVIRSGFWDALWPSEAATPAQAARVHEIADALGAGHLLRRSILELSRGEGRRVLLARALAPRPDALLLDEACDGLDVAAREGFLSLVSAVARGGTAIAMATHRPEELVPEVGRVLWIEEGRIVREGTRAEALSTPSVPRSARSPSAARWEPGNVIRGNLLFSLHHVTVLVDGRAVLADVDWAVRAGERWAVIGPNGAGKSTLLRLLAAQEQPASGMIDRLGLGPRVAAEDLCGRVGVVSPELQARHRHDATGLEVIASGFAGTIGLADPPSPAALEATHAVAARLGVGALLARHVLSLSYGELRKLLLARALAPAPEVLLLDEPLAGLDAAARAWTLGALDAEAARGTAIVAVSHHEDELPPAPDGVLRLAGGRVLRASR
jgi:molybdate transport system ATP-binding protein